MYDVSSEKNSAFLPVAADYALGAHVGVTRVALVGDRVRRQVHVLVLVGVHLTERNVTYNMVITP